MPATSSPAPLRAKRVERATLPLAPGNVLDGKYRIEALLGTGGMGMVLTGTHLLLGHKVALKFPLADRPISSDVEARMRREARAAITLQSEHVARALDYGHGPGGGAYIVYEYLEGRPLRDEIEQRGPLPVSLAVDRVVEACEALAEAHRMGIVHRDIKPSNLFLATRPDGTEVVKVLDFGVAKLLDEGGDDTARTGTSAMIGTVHYAAPEQLRAARHVTPRADVWSLG